MDVMISACVLWCFVGDNVMIMADKAEIGKKSLIETFVTDHDITKDEMLR